MWPSMLRSNQPTTAQAIDEFARARRIRLPDQYKNFLLENNGGVPERRVFPISKYPYDTHGQIKVFLGMECQWATDTLTYAYDLYVDSIPPELLPIASDDLGNYVCLQLNNDPVQVVFWDHRHFWSTGQWRDQDLYHVADSFDEFLELLEPVPE